MNKAVLAVIVIVIILLIGGGVFYAMKKSSPPTAMTTTVSPTGVQKTAAADTSTMQGTLKSLLTEGKTVTCTFSNNASAAAVTGTLFVANGKMRGDFKSTSSQTTVNGHMLVDSGYSYIWTDLSNQGMKMALTAQQTTPAANNRGPSMDSSYTYSCQPWAENDSEFTLPSDITFSTIAIPSGSPTGSTGSTTAGSSSMCAACNNVPAGAGRDACKAQLHCQ